MYKEKKSVISVVPPKNVLLLIFIPKYGEA